MPPHYLRVIDMNPDDFKMPSKKDMMDFEKKYGLKRTYNQIGQLSYLIANTPDTEIRKSFEGELKALNDRLNELGDDPTVERVSMVTGMDVDELTALPNDEYEKIEHEVLKFLEPGIYDWSEIVFDRLLSGFAQKPAISYSGKQLADMMLQMKGDIISGVDRKN